MTDSGSQRRRMQAGFTMGEILAALAVLILLLSLVFPEIQRGLRRGRLTVLDDCARDICAAAQNRLTGLVNSGEAEYLTGTPAERDGVSFLVLTEGTPGLERLLPPGTLESQLQAGHMAIELLPASGTVCGVWFGGETAFPYDVSRDRSRAERLKAHPLTGYWGQEVPDPEPPGTRPLPVPVLNLRNGEELRLEIRIPDLPGMVRDEHLRMDIKMSDGQKEQILLQGGNPWAGSQGTLVLDTLAPNRYRRTLPSGLQWTAGASFRTWAGTSGIRPGAQITVTVTLYSSDGRAVSRSASVTTNSLFAGLEEGKTARIACCRHLENLEPSISGVHWGISMAKQERELDFSSPEWKAAYGNREHRPNENGDLIRYDGQNLLIRNLRAHGWCAGLFGELKGSVRLENILLVNPRVQGTNAGALCGKMEGVTVDGCRAWLEGDSRKPDILSVSGELAGGLIGSADQSRIRNCSASLRVHGKQAGGLTGRIHMTPIVQSYAASFLTGSDLGGLVAVGDGELRGCYAAGILDGAERSASGLAGDRMSVKDCYAAAEMKNMGDKTILRGALPNGNVPFVRQPDLTYQDKSGVPVSAEELSACTALDPASWYVLPARGGNGVWNNPVYAALPYGMDGRTRRLPYPYPQLRSEDGQPVVHRGDWLQAEAAPGELVYYEVYADGEIGLFTPRADGPLDTLRTGDPDAAGIRADGYALLTRRTLEHPEVQMEDGTLLRFSGPSMQTEADGEMQTLYPLPWESLNPETAKPDTYYKVVTLGERQVWFCPWFAAEILTEPPSDRNRPERGYAPVRTPRHLAALSVLTRQGTLPGGQTGLDAAALAVQQQWNLDYESYEGPRTENGTTAWNMGNAEHPQRPIRFTGVYAGNGYEISGLEIREEGEKPAGLFGTLSGASALVEGLRLRDVHVLADSGPAGTLVGRVEGGTLRNCTAAATDGVAYRSGGVAGTGIAGGLAGAVLNGGAMIRCAAAVRVQGRIVGGLAGRMENARLEYCGAAGQTINGRADPGCPNLEVLPGGTGGGLVGELNETVFLQGICYATGTLSLWNPRAQNPGTGTFGKLIGSGGPKRDSGAVLYSFSTAFDATGRPAPLRKEPWLNTSVQPVPDPVPARPYDASLPAWYPWPCGRDEHIGDWPVPQTEFGFFYWEREGANIALELRRWTPADGWQAVQSTLCTRRDEVPVTDWGYGYLTANMEGPVSLQEGAGAPDPEIQEKIREHLINMTDTADPAVAAFHWDTLPRTLQGEILWQLERNGEPQGPAVRLHPAFAGAPAPAEETAAGSPELPLRIRTLGQLQNMGDARYRAAGLEFRQDHDISGVQAGAVRPICPDQPFQGAYDGCGYRIVSLQIRAENHASLFGQVENARLKRIILWDPRDQGEIENTAGQKESIAGGLVSRGTGEMEHCAVAGYVIRSCAGSWGNALSGGLAGIWTGSIEHCQTSVILAPMDRQFSVGAAYTGGGLTGRAEAGTRVFRSYAIGTVKGTSFFQRSFTAGGIAGAGAPDIRECYSLMDLAASRGWISKPNLLPLAPQGADPDTCRYLESGIPGESQGGLTLEQMQVWTRKELGLPAAEITVPGTVPYPFGAVVRVPADPDVTDRWVHYGTWPQQEYESKEKRGMGDADRDPDKAWQQPGSVLAVRAPGHCPVYDYRHRDSHRGRLGRRTLPAPSGGAAEESGRRVRRQTSAGGTQRSAVYRLRHLC